MNTRPILAYKDLTDLFIIDDYVGGSSKALHFLDLRFGTHLNTANYYSGLGALKKVDNQTSILVLENFIESTQLFAAQQTHPKMKVMLITNDQDICSELNSFHVLKIKNKSDREKALIRKYIDPSAFSIKPVRSMRNEFRINRYIAIFVTLFGLMGIGTLLLLLVLYGL